MLTAAAVTGPEIAVALTLPSGDPEIETLKTQLFELIKEKALAS